MSTQYDTIHNHHEQAVFEAVNAGAAAFEHLRAQELLTDVACVALNRIAPRYIRHDVDFSFYLSDKERADNERQIAEAVTFAFEFVQARAAMRARV
jgi:Late competence development protein ComFB